ncbi:MAG: hypothetical protein RBU45_09075 [Myxococcota bacterium]|jgi:hypothetical protein|nr:hypothetical protein [Myxococcota bacterium]
MLTPVELQELVTRVFQPTAAERSLAVLVDLPDAHTPDEPDWQDRRHLARAWVEALRADGEAFAPVDLLLYGNVGRNNADLPAVAWRWSGDELPRQVAELDPAAGQPFPELLAKYRLLLAPTQFSATAPLKQLARTLGFRAATMPGFSTRMIPALRLDYGEIARRVELLKALLDQATAASFTFAWRGSPPDWDPAWLADHEAPAPAALDLHLDLRHRLAHASTGLLPTPGTAGNLPSGEAYVVPYEGELPGDPSQSAGLLPVQLDDELVVYAVSANRAQRVVTRGPHSATEAALLQAEPAYGNLAELGLGVLADLGVPPCGELLLDEKLGLHLAFGRSDHFGGQVGAADFSRAEAVVHLDRVYLPATQPRVEVVAATLTLPEEEVPLIRHDRWVFPFGG